MRFAPRYQLEKLIWFGLALQLGGSLLNLVWSFAGINQAPSVLFGTQMIVMVANAFVMSNSAAGALSVRPEAAGTASGAMGFLQMGIGSLVSQFGAYLGGHSTTTLPLTAAIFAISIACASTMIFIVPRRKVARERVSRRRRRKNRECCEPNLRSEVRGSKFTVVPCACEGSSTPRLLGSIISVSGILGRPVKPGDDS